MFFEQRQTRQPQQPTAVNHEQARQLKTIWLATFNTGKVCSDVLGSGSLSLPGGLAVRDGGVVATFNGSQYQNKVITLPSVKPDTYVIAAKIRATAAQAGNPGAAFGIYSGTSQGGVGVGFDASHNVGLAQLTSGSASLLAYSAGAINTWYTVYAQLIHNGSSVAVGKAWINGKPATTGQGSSAGSGVADLNEISIGAQHRSTGYLRAFTGDIEWAAIMQYIGPENANNYSFTDAEAERLYASGYPWQIFQPRSVYIPVNTSIVGTVIDLTSALLKETSQTIQNKIQATLSTPSLQYVAKAIQNSLLITTTTALLSKVAQTIQNKVSLVLSTPTFTFTPLAISLGTILALGVTTLIFTGWSLDVTGAIATVLRLLALIGVGS